MATVELRIHSDLTEDARPFEEALQLFADAAEGYFAYKMGDLDLNEQNYKAMLWAGHLCGLVAELRPVFEFGFSEEEMKLTALIDGPPYWLHARPLRKSGKVTFVNCIERCAEFLPIHTKKTR